MTAEALLYLRYALEYAMIVPGAIACFMPISDWLRFDRHRGVIFGIGVVLTAVLLGAGLSARWGIPTNRFLFLFLLLFLPFYCCMAVLPVWKLLFAFFTAVMLMGWATLATNYIFASVELLEPESPFQVASSFFCLGLAAMELVIFWRILRFKLAELFASPYLSELWRWLFLLPMMATVYFVVCLPRDLSNVLVGRIRPLSLLTWTGLLGLIFAFYEVFWVIVVRMERELRLEQENHVLRIEEQRYRQFQETMHESRKQRHDFRQHLRLISELAAAERFDELRTYLSDYVRSVGDEPIWFCLNPAVNALAAYYHHAAIEDSVSIAWSLDLPVELPFSEIDFCIVFGNLIENALNAVHEFSADRREIKVVAGRIGSGMIGLSVTNPAKSRSGFELDSAALDSGRESGIGLISVASSVNRLGGTMTIENEAGTFAVFVLINL